MSIIEPKEPRDLEKLGEKLGEKRTLRVIAQEILRDWKKPYFGAVPYLDAMRELDDVNQMYYADTASSIVRYFLANANTWKGEAARRIKLELKTLLKDAK